MSDSHTQDVIDAAVETGAELFDDGIHALDSLIGGLIGAGTGGSNDKDDEEDE